MTWKGNTLLVCITNLSIFISSIICLMYRNNLGTFISWLLWTDAFFSYHSSRSIRLSLRWPNSNISNTKERTELSCCQAGRPMSYLKRHCITPFPTLLSSRYEKWIHFALASLLVRIWQHELKGRNVYFPIRLHVKRSRSIGSVVIVIWPEINICQISLKLCHWCLNHCRTCFQPLTISS